MTQLTGYYYLLHFYLQFAVRTGYTYSAVWSPVGRWWWWFYRRTENTWMWGLFVVSLLIIPASISYISNIEKRKKSPRGGGAGLRAMTVTNCVIAHIVWGGGISFFSDKKTTEGCAPSNDPIRTTPLSYKLRRQNTHVRTGAAQYLCVHEDVLCSSTAVSSGMV